MSFLKNKKEDGCLLIVIIIIIIALVQTKFGCGQSTKETQTGNDDLTDKNYSKTKISFPSCVEEKKYLTESISDLKARIKDLDKAYSQLKNDEMDWDKYIANWNRYTWQLNDSTRNMTFQCIDTYLYKNIISSFGQVGLFYSSGQVSKAKEFEKFFYKYSGDISKEIKTIKF